MSIIVYIIIVAYVLLIGSLIIGFYKVKKHAIIPNDEDNTYFSVIIPFRDEALNLPSLLNSIKNLNYPLSKVSFWFVNDASSDNSKKVVQAFQQQYPEIQISILENKRVSSSPKKDAILTAIHQIESSWVITTDADCILPKQWLQSFHSNIVSKLPKMIVAPVTYIKTASFFNYFQLLDFLSLQGTTIGSFGLGFPFMCNGANLAYQKEAFLEVQAFSGNEHIASGDDVFLLEKFVKKWPSDVHYLKSNEAIVTTFPVDSFSELIQQRLRWASKSKNYKLFTGKFTGILVFATNLCLCFLLLFLILNVFNWKLVLILVLAKFLVDSILLYTILRFTKQQLQPFYFLGSLLLYPFFVVYVAFKSLTQSYRWKNRNFHS